jgi:hypothetical protein
LAALSVVGDSRVEEVVAADEKEGQDEVRTNNKTKANTQPNITTFPT